MEVGFLNEKVEKQCTNLKDASKCFGGDKNLAVSLLARINAIKNAEVLKDIVVQRAFRFHDLHNKNHRDLSGCFAIDVKTIREPWRIILKPLDEQGNTFDPCNIDEIASTVKKVRIREVSKHYE